jgi:hypothetical protein
MSKHTPVPTMPRVHCWGQIDNPLPAFDAPVKSVPHADPARGEVLLLRESAGMRLFWVAYQKPSLRSSNEG